MLKKMVIASIILLTLVLGWHFIFAGAIVISAMVWALTVVSTVLFCVAVLLLFIFTGIGALILGGVVFIWTLLAIIFFPMLIPILAPLFVVFLFISYIRARQKRQADEIKTLPN